MRPFILALFTDDAVTLNNGIGGNKVDCDSITTSKGTVDRQRIVNSSPTDPAGLQPVVAAHPTGLEYGALTRTIQAPCNQFFTTAQTTVNTSAVAITSGSPNQTRRVVKVKNTGTTNLYVGGSGVTTGTGYLLAPGETEEFQLGPAQTMYAVGAVAGGSVCTMEMG